MNNPDQESAPRVIFARSFPPPFLKWLILSFILLIVLFSILYATGYLRVPFSMFKPKTMSTEEITVRCPTPTEFCAKATTLKLSLPKNIQKHDGLGWNLPQNTTIKAAFGGSFKQQQLFGATPSAILITITSPLGRFEAKYIFVIDKQSDISPNLSTKEKMVKAGDILTTSAGIPLTIFGHDGATLQFYIIDKTANGRMILLQPEDLKQKINLPKK